MYERDIWEYSYHLGKHFGDIHESIKTRIIREGVETTAIHEATEWDTPKCGKSVCSNEGRNGVPKGRRGREGRGREITSAAPPVPRIYDSFGGALRMITHAYWTGRRGGSDCVPWVSRRWYTRRDDDDDDDCRWQSTRRRTARTRRR